MKKLIFSIIIFTFLFGTAVLAQETELPDPGLLPDNPFYFLKTWKESIQTFFTFVEENKAKQFLHLSEVRLAEYQKMIDKGKTEIAKKTLDKYEKQLNHALEKADQAKEKGKDVEKLKEEISEKILKHQEVLESVLEKVPEQAKQGIERAIEASQKGFEKATEAVTGEKKEESPAPTEKPVVGQEPTEIRYYTCPDGTKVVSGECYGEGETLICSLETSPELQCPAPTPPVTKGEVCTMAGETKYYQCPNNTQAPWCICGPESRLAGAKNVWQCQYLPELYCPKTTTVPGPAEGMVGCCLSDGVCQFETKEHCNLKNGKEVSFCTVKLCPKPTPVPVPTPNPITDYIYSDCVKEGMKTYKCPAGNIINWKCSCQVSEPTDPKYRAGGYTTWSCSAESEKYCPITSGTPLAVTLLYLKYYHPISVEVCWSMNKAIVSRYVEYGTTVSYGSAKESGSSDEGKLRGCAYFSVNSVDPTDLKPLTTYHFRIVSEDANGNKIISDDYTFTTE